MIASRNPISPYERDRLLRRLAQDAEMVDPVETLPLMWRDAKDERILDTALAARADFLVTGDKDLQAIAGDPRLGSRRIVTVAEFLAILEDQASNDVDVYEDPEASDDSGDPSFES